MLVLGFISLGLGFSWLKTGTGKKILEELGEKVIMV